MDSMIRAAVLGSALWAPWLAAQPGAQLVYQVAEEGYGNYLSRILVTPDHVRLDEGEDGGGYTLFDRRQEIIYNVLPNERAVLVINPAGTVPERPADLLLEDRVSTDTAAPTVGGAQPQDVELLANGGSCARLVVVPGVMEEALEGLRELRLVLARVQAATMLDVPGGIETPCEQAELVYAPNRDLAHGLPIHYRGPADTRDLVDFRPAAELADALFEIPAGYHRMAMPGLATP
jgi:hypothetical protein